MQLVNAYPRRQFVLARACLGALLCYQLLTLLPYAKHLVEPEIAFALLAVGGAAAGLFAAGYARKPAAVVAWLAIVGVMFRNPGLYDFDWDYLPWLLLATVFVDDDERDVRVPRLLYVGAWAVLAVSYTFSGISKFLQPEWRHGEVVRMVLGLTLSRVDLPADPPVLLLALMRVATWFTLFAETAFLPLALFRRTRPWALLFMTFVQIGIGSFVRVTELNLALLVFHLFVLEAGWVGKIQAWVRNSPAP
jgi:hypothetical protein